MVSITPKHNLLALAWCLGGCCIAPLVGCNHTKHTVAHRVGSHAASSGGVSSAYETLPLIANAEKPPIEIAEGSQKESSELLREPLLDYRQLTILHCKELAIRSARVANELDSHRRWLACYAPCSPWIGAMEYQAKQERIDHVARSMDVFLDLAELQGQWPLVEEISVVLSNAENAVVKFQEAGVASVSGITAIQQKRFELQEQSSLLRFSERKLNRATETLLNLDPTVQIPIWPVWKQPSRDWESNKRDWFEVAITQRPDLAAIVHLATHSGQFDAQSTDSIESSANPYFAPKIPTPHIAKWTECFWEDELEAIRRRNAVERQRQLWALVEIKKQQIRQEISEAETALHHHCELIELKRKRWQHLKDSHAAAEKAKDDVELKFDAYIEEEVQLLRLQTEIVHEAIAIEKDWVRLLRAAGVLLDSDEYLVQR